MRRQLLDASTGLGLGICQIPVGVCSCACRGWGIATPPPLRLNNLDNKDFGRRTAKRLVGAPGIPLLAACTGAQRSSHRLPFFADLFRGRHDLTDEEILAEARDSGIDSQQEANRITSVLLRAVDRWKSENERLSNLGHTINPNRWECFDGIYSESLPKLWFASEFFHDNAANDRQRFARIIS
jgi:hypothetical protein